MHNKTARSRARAVVLRFITYFIHLQRIIVNAMSFCNRLKRRFCHFVYIEDCALCHFVATIVIVKWLALPVSGKLLV